MERKVIVIAGPTCSGKTSVSIAVAEALKTEIISADSRQIYKYLNIGTAKPSYEILSRIKHHLIDLLYPDQPFDANLFELRASGIISDLHRMNKIPVVAGGSGLYLRALIDGLYDTADKDEDYRQKLMKDRELYGNEYLYNKLKETDPASASKMIPQNWKRVMRALEVFHISGKSILHHQQEYKRTSDINYIMFALDWDRVSLYNRINRRADEMVSSGLLEEVKFLLEKGYSSSLNALNTVGYKEMIAYFKGLHDLDKAVELIKRNTRRYAKRQLTWFKADKRFNWIEIQEENDLQTAAGKILLSIT